MKNNIPKHVPAFLKYHKLGWKEISLFFKSEGLEYKYPKQSLFVKLSPNHKTAFNFHEHVLLQKMKKHYDNLQRTDALIYKRENMLDSDFLRTHKIIKDHARKR